MVTHESMTRLQVGLNSVVDWGEPTAQHMRHSSQCARPCPPTPMMVTSSFYMDYVYQDTIVLPSICPYNMHSINGESRRVQSIAHFIVSLLLQTRGYILDASCQPTTPLNQSVKSSQVPPFHCLVLSHLTVTSLSAPLDVNFL